MNDVIDPAEAEFLANYEGPMTLEAGNGPVVSDEELAFSNNLNAVANNLDDREAFAALTSSLKEIKAKGEVDLMYRAAMELGAVAAMCMHDHSSQLKELSSKTSEEFGIYRDMDQDSDDDDEDEKEKKPRR